MSRRWTVFFLLWSVCLGCGTWLLAQKSQEPLLRHDPQTAYYATYKSSGTDMLLDSVHGKTWLLRRLQGDGVVWLPIPKIDSEGEAKEFWKNTVNYGRELEGNERTLSIDKILKERGYVSVSLDPLRGGYLCLEVRANGEKVYLILDTGSPITHLDIKRTKHLQLKWHSWNAEEIGKGITGGISGRITGPVTGGLTSVDPRSFSYLTKLEVGGLEVGRVLVGSDDQSETNKILRQYVDREIDGELGLDILVKLSAIIDHSTLKLYLRPPDWHGREEKGGKKKVSLRQAKPGRGG